MIDLKDAISRAEQTARSIYSEAELKGLRVEELEITKDNQWLITLGWPEPHTRTIAASAFGGLTSAGGVYAVPRVYKQFIFDASSGAFLSMKDRNL